MGTVQDVFPYMENNADKEELKKILRKLEEDGGIYVSTPKDPEFNKLKEAQKIMLAPTFREYFKKPFLATTQNLSYIEKFNKDIGEAFTILGSGDSIFQLVYKGVKNITAIDTNEFQADVYRLKKACVLALSYEEFYDFVFDTKGIRFLEYNIFKSKIMPYFDKNEESSKKFWEKFFRAYEPVELITKFFKGGIERGNFAIVKESLRFMKKKSNYEKMKRNMENLKLEIKIGDALSFLAESKRTYEWIDLSNILLYIFQDTAREGDLTKRCELLKQIKEKNLNENGVLILDYMFASKEEFLTPHELKDGEEKKTIEIYHKIYEYLIRLFGEDLKVMELRNLLKAMPTRGIVDSVIFTEK